MYFGENAHFFGGGNTKTDKTQASFLTSAQVSIATTPGKVDVIEVQEVSAQLREITKPSTSKNLSTADVEFTAKLLLDLAIATSVSGDTNQERGVERNVSQLS